MKTKVALLLTLILGLTFPLSAQHALVVQIPPSAYYLDINAVADDGQGNTYIAGYFDASLTLGSITLTGPVQRWTGFVAKYNSTSGAWLWAKKINPISGSLSTDARSLVYDLAIDNAGNVFITGEYRGKVGFDNLTLTSTKSGTAYTMDIFVAKTNTNGVFQWASSFGTKTGTDAGNGIIVDAAANIYVSAYFTKQALSGCGAEISIYDIGLLRLSSTGSAVWQKRYASNSLACYSDNNRPSDLCLDGSGHILLGGQFMGTVSFGNGTGLSVTSSGAQDIFLAKINSGGTTQWVRRQGGTISDSGSSVHGDASGNAYVSGKIGPDDVVTKYNATGTLLWLVDPYPGPGLVTKGLLPFENNLRTGHSKVGFKTLALADGVVLGSDSLIVNDLGVNDPNATGNFTLHDSDQAGAGYVAVFTGRCGFVTLGNLTLSADACPDISPGDDDWYIVRYNTIPIQAAPPQPGSVTDLRPEYSGDSKSIEVYPNPASDQLHITLPERENETTLFIQNQYGRIVWTEKLESQRRNTTINLDGQIFQSGIYFMISLSDGKITTRRFVIEK